MTATIDIAWTAAMLVLPYVLAVVAFKWGTDWINRRTAADGFAADFIPTCDEVSAEVTRVDEAMVAHVVERDRWGS